MTQYTAWSLKSLKLKQFSSLSMAMTGMKKHSKEEKKGIIRRKANKLHE